MPMPMSPPMMNPQQGSNLLAGLTEKMTKKVMNTVTDTMGQQLSQQATEALQQGVPFGHVLDHLLKMSPLSMQNQAGVAGGGGGQPPQGPTPSVKRPEEGQGQAMAITQPQATQQDSQSSQTTGQTFDPSSLNQPIGQGQQAQQSQNILMNLIKGLYPIAALPGEMANRETMMKYGKQEAYGKTPEGKLRSGIATAKETPPTQYEQKSLEASRFSAQTTALNDQLKSMDEQEKNLQEQMKTFATTRGSMNKAFGGPSKEMTSVYEKIRRMRVERAKVQDKLFSLTGNPQGSSSGYTKTGTYNGKKVGMKADGTVEYI